MRAPSLSLIHIYHVVEVVLDVDALGYVGELFVRIDAVGLHPVAQFFVGFVRALHHVGIGLHEIDVFRVARPTLPLGDGDGCLLYTSHIAIFCGINTAMVFIVSGIVILLNWEPQCCACRCSS